MGEKEARSHPFSISKTGENKWCIIAFQPFICINTLTQSCVRDLGVGSCAGGGDVNWGCV
jgi:hypothetical protein